MTRNDDAPDFTGESSRRTFMKAGALASGGLALGLSGAGSAIAQDGGQDGGQQMRGLMFQNQFFPRAQFTIVSRQLDWAPVAAQNGGEGVGVTENVGVGVEPGVGFGEDSLFENPSLFQNFNTRVVRYEFAGNQFALLMVPANVNVERGQTYQLSPVFDSFGTEDFGNYGIGEGVSDAGIGEGFNELGVLTVQFSPVGGNETTTQSGNN